MSSLQRRGVVSNGAADGHSLTAVYEVTGGRERVATYASGPDEDLSPRRGGKHQFVLACTGKRGHCRIVMCVVSRERGDCDARVEND